MSSVSLAPKWQPPTVFAQAQISNFNERMESLHENGCGRDRLGMSLGASDRTPANGMVVKAPLPRSVSSGDETGWPDTGVSASAKEIERAARHPALQPARAMPCRVWSAGYLFGNTSNLPQVSAYQFTTAGVSGGVDLRVNDYFTAGAGFGYGNDSTDIGTRGTKSYSGST